MPLNVLVVGAGICGPAFAMLLQKADPGHNITVIERTTSLRIAGQQIDAKSHSVEILKRMNLLAAIKSHHTNETGIEIVDPAGKSVAVFGVNPTGQNRPALTAEYEIMRGDFVQVLYDASLEQDERLKQDHPTKGTLTYEFGRTITELTQGDNRVNVTFSDGQTNQYDLVVAADGQGSRTRRQAFGQEASAAGFKSVGVHGAYFSIPRSDGEGGLARGFSATKRRMIFTRTGDRPVTQVLLFIMKGDEKLSSSYKESIEAQKLAFAEAFKDAGWQTDRFLSEMESCTDFYAHEVAQIKMEKLSTGRVVLLGDAGYGPSPFTGMGSTLSLTGAYILAGELSRHGNDVAAALKAYEDNLRPCIAECQKLPKLGLGSMFPSSQFGTWFLRNVVWFVAKIDQFSQRFQSGDKDQGKETVGWKLPEYPELKL